MGLKSTSFFRSWLGIAVILIGVVFLCVGAYMAYPRLVSTNVSGIKANRKRTKTKRYASSAP